VLLIEPLGITTCGKYGSKAQTH